MACLDQSRISVIIPTYNRAEMVARCVRSVLATDYPALEVIVVDDCSPDDTRARLAADFGADPRVKYFRNDRNSFQAVSRNRGAKAATGEYLCFLDDDNIVRPDIFSELMAVYAKAPQAGLVAPLAVHRRQQGENLVWSLGSDFSRWTSQPKDFHPNLPFAEFRAEPSLAAREVFPTAYSPNAFMVPRRLFDRVGGFDESLVLIYEESDFGFRIGEAGYRNFIAARAITDHYGFLEPGCARELRQLGIERPLRTYYFARNRIRFARRHFSFLQALSVAFIFAPLSVVYYGCVALKNRRADIAFAYLKGTLAGLVGR